MFRLILKGVDEQSKFLSFKKYVKKSFSNKDTIYIILYNYSFQKILPQGDSYILNRIFQVCHDV